MMSMDHRSSWMLGTLVVIWQQRFWMVHLRGWGSCFGSDDARVRCWRRCFTKYDGVLDGLSRSTLLLRHGRSLRPTLAVDPVLV